MSRSPRSAPWGPGLALVAALAFSSFVCHLRADNPPARWERDIKAFEASDRTNPPPANAILFVGSSSVRMWKTLAEDFPGIPVINRGYGGSEMQDTLFFADRIVTPYRPRQVVVYAGDNDLAAGKSPERVAADFEAFVKKVWQSLPQTSIAYIAVKPSPSRWRLADAMRETNRLISRFATSEQRLSFIDVFTPMLDENGKPREELFVQDKLHLNREGYRLWATIVRPFLVAEKPQEH